MRLRISILVITLALLTCQPVLSLNRVQDLFGQNPQATWQGMKERNIRIGIGTYWWQILCSSSLSCPGGFSNLTIIPVLGLNVAVGPSFGNTVGAVYQLGVDDATAFGGYPSGVGTFLPPDPTQIIVQGIAFNNTANIGPLTPPGTSGQTIDYLIECNVLTVDMTSQPINVVNSSGAISGASANRDRNDIVSCKSKAGVPAADGSQVAPTVDNGYVQIGYVAVPFGTSTINTGMVHGYPTLSGYVSLSPPSQQIGTINVSGGITSGGGFTGTTGTFTGAVASVGDTSGGDITTYRSTGDPTTGFLFFGNSGLQSIGYDGTSFLITAAIKPPSIVSRSLISPANSNLVVGAGSGTGNVSVNYNTGATGGLSVYNGGTGLGPFVAGSAAITGPLSANGVTSSSGITGTSGLFSGPVSGTTGTFSNGLYTTNGALYLNSGSQYLYYNGTSTQLTSPFNAPSITSAGTVYGAAGNFTSTTSGTSTLGNAYATSLTMSGGGPAAPGQVSTPSLVANTITSNNTVNASGSMSAPTGYFNTLVASNGLIYLNAADTQYMYYSGGNTNFTAPLTTPGIDTNSHNNASGQVMMTNDGNNTILRPSGGAGYLYFENNGGGVIGYWRNDGYLFPNGDGSTYYGSSANNTGGFGTSGGVTAGGNISGNVLIGNGFSTGGNTSTGTLNVSGQATVGGLGAYGNISGNVISGNGFSTGGNTTTGSLNATTISASGTSDARGGYLSPMYGASGNTLGSNAHTVFGTCANNGTINCTVNLSGKAVFAGAATFSCTASPISAAVTTGVYITNGGTTFVIHNTDNVPWTGTVTYACTGY